LNFTKKSSELFCTPNNKKNNKEKVRINRCDQHAFIIKKKTNKIKKAGEISAAAEAIS